VNELDRATVRRRDPAWLASALASHGRLVPTYRGKSLLDDEGRARFVELASIERALHATLSDPLRAPVFLGVEHARDERSPAYFAIDLGGEPDEAAALAVLGAPAGAQFVDLRVAPLPIAGAELETLLYARALEQWRRAQRFCSRCGAETAIGEAGHVAVCTRCETHHFPRTDAAMIVLVVDEATGRVLLGRQPSWPKGMYSTLAGFVEAGESLEAAVVREVREESGIEVSDVRYAGSQPWPFPQSLMVGVYARARTTAIALDDELEDARWFSRDELGALETRQGRFIKIDTMAMRLIRGWLAGTAGRPL